MKRCFLLIICLLILACSIAYADSSEIIGSWYACTSINDIMDDYFFEINLFFIRKDFMVTSATIDFKTNGEVIDKFYGDIGMWSKDENRYYYLIPGNGSIEMYIEDGCLLFPINDAYYRLRKLQSLDVFNDYIKIRK